MTGYTVTDLLAALEAAVLFALFLVPPGYLLGFASNALGFRRRSASERFLLSLVLSLAIAPIIAVLFGRLTSLTATVALFLACAAVSIVLVLRELLSGDRSGWHVDRTTWIALGMMAAWVVLAVFTLVDWQYGDRLYVSYVAYDHSIRVMLVDAAARTGVPPRNPLYGLGGAPVLRYFYYWYVLCALPVHLAGISPRASLNGSVLWSGFALAALIPLYLKHFFDEHKNLRLKSVVGIGLLLVTGYDLIPFVYLSHRLHALWGDTEWWDTNQVTSWMGSLLWVPHHVACLTACLTGFLLLSTLADDAELRERIWAAVLAGAAFSCAAGLSVYVTFVFAIFVVVWTLILLLIKRPKDFLTFAGAGAISLLLALPYLNDLRGPSAAGSRFAFFAFRDYSVAEVWFKLQGIKDPLMLKLLQYPTLIIVYFFEFGVYFLAACYCLRREVRGGWKITLRQRAAWVLFAVCLLTVTFVASDSTGVNDLGFRGMLVVQFVLLLWAAPLVSELFLPKGQSKLGLAWKSALWLSLVLGVLGTILQLGVLRAYAPVVDAGMSPRTEPWLGDLPGIGKHTYRLREGLDRMKAITPTSSVIQYNPVGRDVFLFHLYADRQAAIGDESCGSGFGGDMAKCKESLPYFKMVFNTPIDFSVDQFCDLAKVKVLLVTSSDPVWKDEGSWVWTRKPLFADDSMRAFACGTAN